MSAQIAADLRAAADVLERDGWRNDGLARSDDDTCRCVAQAIHFVMVGRDDGWPADDRYNTALWWLADKIGAESPSSVFDWNDSRESAAEVIAALRAAADAAEAQR